VQYFLVNFLTPSSGTCAVDGAKKLSLITNTRHYIQGGRNMQLNFRIAPILHYSHVSILWQLSFVPYSV